MAEHRAEVVNTLNLAKPAAGPTLLTVAEVDALPRVRPRPARAAVGRAPTRRSRAPACPATSSSSRRRSTRCGCATRRSSTATPATTSPANRCPPTWPARLTDAAPAFGEGLATTEYLAAAAARPGLAPARAGRGGRTTWRRSRRRRWPRRASAVRAAPALPQRLLQPRLRRRRTPPPTTPTSGARCSTPTPSSGSASSGGLRRENGEVFAEALLSRGGTVDPMEAYRAFRGRDPEIGPLLARRGLAAD